MEIAMLEQEVVFNACTTQLEVTASIVEMDSMVTH